MSVKNITQQPVRLYTAPYYPDQPARPFRISNLDNTQTIYLDETTDINTDSTPLPPQATVTYSGNRDIYASSLSATNVLCDLDYDSLTWDNPVGVQIALNALGLAKDTTVQGVNTSISLGTNPAITAQTAPGKTIAQDVGGTGLNAALPVKATSFGPFAANAAWGPTAVFTFPLGGAYKIIITPSVAGDAFVTDLTVTHQDSAGATVYTEDFTVSNIGNSGLTGGTSPLGGVIVRGNLQGPKITLSGLTISSANFTAIGGIGTVSGINVALYYDSHMLPESKPKVVPWINTGFLAFTQALSIVNGANFNYGILPSYAGRAFWTMHTPSANANFVGRVSSFSVANGTGSLYVQFTQGVSTGNILDSFQFALDQLLHIYQINNVGTATGTVDSSLVMTDFV